MSDIKYTYVIMPVGADPLYAIRRAAIERGILRGGLKPHFPDYVLEKPAFRLADLQIALLNAESVIADLSHERPSCYYEVGVAEALGKQIALIAEIGTPIHQCVARNSVRYYRNVADISSIVADILYDTVHLELCFLRL